jgi:hypothetical protein
MKPMLKPPGPMRLKLNCDTLLSTYAFDFNLRRYTAGVAEAETFFDGLLDATNAIHPSKVGRCSLNR